MKKKKILDHARSLDPDPDDKFDKQTSLLVKDLIIKFHFEELKQTKWRETPIGKQMR